MGRDAAGAKDADRVAVGSVAAGVGADALDAIVPDDRAVISRRRAPDLQAVGAAAVDVIVRDRQPRRIETVQRRLRQVAERRALDAPAAALELEPIALRVLERAIDQP